MSYALVTTPYCTAFFNGKWLTDKKDNEIFLLFIEIQMGSVAKSCMRKGLLIFDETRKYLTIYEEAVSHIWLYNRSLLNFLIYEENLIFFLSVRFNWNHGAIFLFFI